MHAGAFYVKPSKNAVVSSPPTPTWAVGTADGDFPLANVLTLEPDDVAKANENTATLRLTWGGAKTLTGIAFLNLNFPGVTVSLTNNAGMVAQTKTVPTPEDEVSISVFFDLTDVANTTATQWNLAVAGSNPVTIGTVIASELQSEFRMRWDYVLRERFPVISHRTSYQKRKQYRIPLRYRECSGVPFWAADLEALRTLRRETLGSMHPFLFVLDDEPMLVQFGPDTHEETASWVDLDHEDERGQGVVEHPITLEEVSNGISLLS